VAGREIEARRDLRLARPGAAEGPARLEQPRSGGPMDRAVDSAAAEQGAVGSVDDRVDLEGRDVALPDLDRTPEVACQRRRLMPGP